MAKENINMKKTLIEIGHNHECHLNTPNGDKIRCSWQVDSDSGQIKIILNMHDIPKYMPLYSVPDQFSLIINEMPASGEYSIDKGN